MYVCISARKNLTYSYPNLGPYHVSAPGLHPKYNYEKFLGGILLITKDHFRTVSTGYHISWCLVTFLFFFAVQIVIMYVCILAWFIISCVLSSISELISYAGDASYIILKKWISACYLALSSLTHSRRGPQHHPWVSTCDGLSSEVSRRCTVYRCPCRVGHVTCSDGGLDIVSSFASLVIYYYILVHPILTIFCSV